MRYKKAKQLSKAKQSLDPEGKGVKMKKNLNNKEKNM